MGLEQEVKAANHDYTWYLRLPFIFEGATRGPVIINEQTRLMDAFIFSRGAALWSNLESDITDSHKEEGYAVVLMKTPAASGTFFSTGWNRWDVAVWDSKRARWWRVEPCGGMIIYMIRDYGSGSDPAHSMGGRFIAYDPVGLQWKTILTRNPNTVNTLSGPMTRTQADGTALLNKVGEIYTQTLAAGCFL